MIASPSAPASTANAVTWTIDPSHSSVEFSARHMMFSNVKGQFSQFEGLISGDPADPANARVEVTIAASSVDSRSADRDTHLRAADFLDVERFPAITFRGTRVEPRGDQRLLVVGDLTIRDVTREIALDTSFGGRGVNPWGKSVVGYSAKAEINRRDFGLTWNVALEAGGVLVSDTIKLNLEIEAVRDE
ncbi:MAG: YceI family protein [Chloroflexota bacterium]|nr:YceI family protein [Chloroflexota bacterium]